MVPRRLPATLLLLAAAACGDDPAPGPASVPGPGDGPSTAPPPPSPDPEPVAEDVAVAQRRIDEMRAAVDREAHRLLDVFRSRVHDPMRDDGLRRAEGRVSLEIDGRKGEYEFTFDAARPDDGQTTVTAVREDRGLHAGAPAQAKRFVVLAVRGAYSQVLSYAPPVQWSVVRSEDGRTILVAPPFRSQTGVSYRLDGTGLVEMSGATDGKSSSRTVFHWSDWKGRSLLARSVEDAGKAATEYVYEEDRGVPLLRRATLVEGAHRCAASLLWSVVERR